jgi:hypothetical protein
MSLEGPILSEFSSRKKPKYGFSAKISGRAFGLKDSAD